MTTASPMPRSLVTLAALLAALALPSCVNVQPWERDRLASPSMALDAEAVTAGLDAHIYFSKESASGGQGFGGGGCGCN
ncbi:DUF4266 domain-containing protein [Algiphilus sp.]|uniref:DUF4266 domain-containing protein n=1 Tax=Algiphilus sp. TaxID=1872431 RepID=UPI0032EC3447